MRFLSFQTNQQHGYGLLIGDSIARLDTRPGFPADLRSFLAAYPLGRWPVLPTTGDLPLASVRLLPPIPNPGKVICVATNFHEPATQDKPVPDYPLLFTRFAEAQTGHGTALLKPAASDRFDFEGELAVIIGTPGHKITEAEAMAHVAGYACFNDGSVRDWQKHSSQFTPGKNFHQSAGFGPWMVCTDEIPDPAALALETRVNGVVKQAITLDRMIFSIPWLMYYISTFTPLAPGDVIVTGTPSGFGSTRQPPEFLRAGDVIDVQITGIGTLSNTVAQDSDPRPAFTPRSMVISQ